MIAWINASIIHGSVVFPPSYVVAASDLLPKQKQNAMTKFADDTYLLVGSRSVDTVTDEVDNIRNWAAASNMLIHPSKTKELIVYRGRNRHLPESASPLIAGAERVSSLRVLVVLLNSKLAMTEHIIAILSTCSSSTYTLRLLRSRGLQPQELHLVARATTVVSVLYAALAWWGFAGEGDHHRMERLVTRLHQSGYLPPDFPDLATLVENVDTKLFNSIRHNILRHYLRDKPVPVRSLRAKAHNFVLPHKDNRNFVSKALYEALCPSNC